MCRPTRSDISILLHNVGAGVLKRHPRLIVLALELLNDELDAFENPPTLDANTAWNPDRFYK